MLRLPRSVSDAAFPPPAPPPTSSKWAERMALLGWSLLLFAICFALGTRHHRFPYYYHPDEPGKAEQIISGQFNFNHPMLLLATTRLATDVFHVPNKPQAVVEAGRCVSAAFMAGAVVMLSLVAYLWRGWRAALMAGAALTLHHQLYELSHYLKEDSALLFGVAATFLAAMAYAQRVSVLRAAILGAACALAISGKYIGLMMLAIALPVLWVSLLQARRNPAGGSSTGASALPIRPWQHISAFLGALLLVFVAVNFAMLFNFVTLGHSVGKEVELVMHGQGDVTRSVPHALYWNVFIDNSNPIIWLTLTATMMACLPRWRRLNILQKLLVAFPFAYALMLSFSPKENDRYFLPATAIFTLLAAIGVEALPLLLTALSKSFGSRGSWRLLKPSARRWIYGITAPCLILLQITGWAPTKPGWSQYDAAFVRDDIAGLITWMKTELPPTAVVVADSRVGLPNPGKKKHASRGKMVPQTLIVSKLASDKRVLERLHELKLYPKEVTDKSPETTADDLRQAGVTHVAVSENSYGRFFRKDLRPKDLQDKKFMAGKAFYEDLLRNGELLFERDRGTVIYLHPGIRVYRL